MVNASLLSRLVLLATVSCSALIGCTGGKAVDQLTAALRPGQLVLMPTTATVASRTFNADEGFVVVTENPADSLSRRISLPVFRIHSANPTPREPIFWLNGGPGLSNMRYRPIAELLENHDVMLVGYRGVDGSTVLASDEVQTALKGVGERHA
ncbi:MAG: hypothetical protein AAB393_03185, partial [Bacteroidota bacterium]